MPPLKPPALRPGDTIGICAPAWAFEAEETRSVEALLRSMGYEVYAHPQLDRRRAALAGDVEERAQALHELFEAPEVRAVLLARGGYGGIQLLEHLDFDLIRSHPKIVVGYSDNTVLLLAIQAMTGLVTFHGPSAHKLLPDERDASSTRNLFEVLGGALARHTFPHDGYAPRVVRPGTVEGPLNGGNHVLVHSLVGTPYLPDFDRTIFFTESNQPKYYDVDQDLYHFRYAGLTESIQALILGEMQPVHAHVEAYADKDIGRDLRDMARLHHPDTPSVIDFPCGHHRTLLTFPLGIRHRLTLDHGGGVALEQVEPACVWM